MGKVVAYQVEPCKEDNCKWEEYFREPVPLQNCTSEKKKEIKEYYVKIHGKDFGQNASDNALCFDMDDFYLSGEPGSYLEAVLIIGFEWHPDIITDWTDPDYDSDLHWYYFYSNP